MYKIDLSTRFRRDYKLAMKRGLPESKLEEVLKILRQKGKLPSHYKQRKLKGKYAGLWECHIQPDWLLIWDQSDEIRLSSLIRTGSHSDLF
ncbi:MAG: type II toxin-antitoxin system YafQ family toxin [Cyclobacteriaceae bacterium]